MSKPVPTYRNIFLSEDIKADSVKNIIETIIEN